MADGWNPELVKDSEEAIETMLTKSPDLKTYLDESYGYAIFPKVTKGAVITFGAAAGKGIVYRDNEIVSYSHLKQASLGFQLGGQQYSEVIFFENKEAFDKFMNEKLKFDAQVSAVAIKYGVSLDAAYAGGVAIFTHAKGGLMYEASLGGQHFKNKEIN
jgi:lipid-binding SYLF domain-containing protein